MLSGKPKEEKSFKKKMLQVGKAVVRRQLEGDALKIINSKLGTRYRSLNQVSLEEIIKLPTIYS
jgi:hypothetical protein